VIDGANRARVRRGQRRINVESEGLAAYHTLSVARGAHWPKIDTPSTTLHRFAAATFELDRLERATDADEPFWIYSAERCVVDAMRLQRVTGRDVALSALRRYMRRDDANPLRLTELARSLGGAPQIGRALELILA
jgi:hypothetical protein